MVKHIIDTSVQNQESLPQNPSVASGMNRNARKQLSLQALRRGLPITRIAQQNDVSRKFVYQQVAKATQAIDEAFQGSPKDKDVLFHLPVTKQWIHQFVLAQVLYGHSSFRAVQEILGSLFDYHDLSLGSIYNIIQEAIVRAGKLNDLVDISLIRVGAHDEIYQADKPVLVGMDVVSTYCYLLAVEDHCDETTWGVHLLDLLDQGLLLDHTIADGGLGLRAGQKAAWGNTPCNGDVFHAEKSLKEVVSQLANRARGCTTAREKIQRKYDAIERSCKPQTLGRKLSIARQEEEKAHRVATDVHILTQWMCRDVLTVAGPHLVERQKLFDFIVAELEKRIDYCSYRLGLAVRMLKNHRDNLLAFVGVLHKKLSHVADRFSVPLSSLYAICELEGLSRKRSVYWQRLATLQATFKKGFYRLHQAVLEVLSNIPRTSSIVENLNSRLRNYFFLRRHIGHGYLHLLRFFLNHRPFLRSERPERVGKSPAELLSGQSHPHWLEMLGYTRFHRN